MLVYLYPVLHNLACKNCFEDNREKVNLETYIFLFFLILACLLMLKFIFDMRKLIKAIRLPVKYTFRFQNQSFVSNLLSEFEFGTFLFLHTVFSPINGYSKRRIPLINGQLFFSPVEFWSKSHKELSKRRTGN